MFASSFVIILFGWKIVHRYLIENIQHGEGRIEMNVQESGSLNQGPPNTVSAWSPSRFEVNSITHVDQQSMVEQTYILCR